MLISRKRVGAQAAYTNANPGWMDMAAHVLFRKDELEDETGLYSLQQAVAEALKVAYEMGQQGRKPPRPPGEPRRYSPPPVDEEIARIEQELRMLAWSPATGQKAPPGAVAYRMRRAVQEREESHVSTVRRSRPAPQPVAQPTMIRRSRR